LRRATDKAEAAAVVAAEGEETVVVADGEGDNFTDVPVIALLDANDVSTAAAAIAEAEDADGDTDDSVVVALAVV
jgi:hypothetical protein